LISIAKPEITDKEFENIKKVLDSGMLAQGEVVEEFEKKFAEYIGVDYAIATNSGTSALHTALASLGIKKGDEVITTDFSFIASATCIIMQGATPVFCDINRDNCNINVDLIENLIIKKTRAILPVHLYGQPCDMDKIMTIAQEYDLYVIEDACQAHGAIYKNKRVGSIGDVGTFSFYPTKNMTTSEGGILTTNNKNVADKAREFRNHGQSKRYFHNFLGYNYRMTNIAAAIGIAQLEKLDTVNKKRQENAEFLNNEIQKIQGITPMSVSPDINHVYHQYTIKTEENFRLSRDELAQYLTDNEVGVGIYYPIPIHKQPLFKDLSYDDTKVNCPVATMMAKKVLSLPIHHNVTILDLERIIETIKNAGE
jgi:dTDP-4-amino-4,6-dideoxygalactose transaminase